ncbi:unnamed protein product [Didymodactylos carnosus]|uniref:Transposase n=2 Tax=Didymodactylos carnosus TaxID=1234261 RepID=A0A8S2NRY0_9BILA|nr:unnamed protein product [Didymodactylos carnosus]CAF4009585.1 unnamed protein product [Didymodactylos carnosus]
MLKYIDADHIKSVEIKRKLENGDYVLIRNNQGTAEFWNDICLIGMNNENNENAELAMLTTEVEVLEGYVACRYCKEVYQSHSAKKADGRRVNYGTTSAQNHVRTCKKRSGSNNTSPSISRFMCNKKHLPAKMQEKIKDAQLKFVVGGLHSFSSIEKTGLLELCQLCIDIGSAYDRMNVNEIFYGRTTISGFCQRKFEQVKAMYKNVLQKPLQEKNLACTTDLWRDDYLQRYYLDFTAFWIDEDWNLQHGLLHCRYFDYESKTGENIWKELEKVYEAYNLSIGDTPITTDSGSNIKAALYDEARYPCLAHATNIVLETAWNETKNNNSDFHLFCTSVSDLRTFVVQSGNIQHHLPKTLKGISGTRPWRSYYLIHESIQHSYEKLRFILEKKREDDRLYRINKHLLDDIVKLMENFVAIFDILEFSFKPTLQNVVPAYYSMCSYVEIDPVNDRPVIRALKLEIQKTLDSKYWPSITRMHCVATFLDPSLKYLLFVEEKKYRDLQMKEIVKDIQLLASSFDFKGFISENEGEDEQVSHIHHFHLVAGNNILFYNQQCDRDFAQEEI